MSNIVTPVLRIFDYQKALEFYVDYLGFKVDWEHQYADNMPVYMQVSRNGVVLHLSEHHGDGTPGSKVLIEWEGLKSYHAELKSKKYKYLNPGITKTPWKARCVDTIDPFGNKLKFTEER